MDNVITYITMMAGFMTLIAGTATTIWFIRDVRKENSKVFKRQEALLALIEEGQRKGFAALAESQNKGFAVLAESQNKGFVVLQEGNISIQKSIQTMQSGIQQELRYIAELLAGKNKI